jgi:YHS domain-containing protein
LSIDPVCEMDVDPKTARWKSDYRGKEYYFCAPGCERAFDKDPEKYAHS